MIRLIGALCQSSEPPREEPHGEQRVKNSAARLPSDINLLFDVGHQDEKNFLECQTAIVRHLDSN